MEHLIIAQRRWQARFSTQPLLVWVWLGPRVFRRCLAAAEWLLLKSFLSCQLTPFLFTWLRHEAFPRDCLSVLIGVSELFASLAPSLRYTRQNENPSNSLLCCSLGPRSLASLPSPKLPGFSNVCFVLHTVLSCT